MKDLLRSKFVMGGATLVLVAAIAISLTLAAATSSKAAPAVPHFGKPGHVNPVGELDCNGFSATGQKVAKIPLACTDLNGLTSDEGRNGKGEDNGHYIGHDEPTTQFLSTTPGSGNNVRWNLTLPTEGLLTKTQNFENYVAFWFSMALCDPRSFPQGPCTPDSDSNNPNRAGSAFLEMQFYPPGFAPFISSISCDTTHWCASLHINSVECVPGLGCNPNCTEPTNFAFVQMDGIPTGPPGPDTATAASFTPNAETLLMNTGDNLTITISDTPGFSTGGVTERIIDNTTGKSGFMIASAANGFRSLNPFNCQGFNFSFHPEYSTSRLGNDVPWAALQANVGFAVETGHFETTPDEGITSPTSDDPPCFSVDSTHLKPGCLDAQNFNGDIDFDGTTTYAPNWPGDPNGPPSSLNYNPPLSAPNGSSNYSSRYPQMQFETDIPASEPNCTANNIPGCTVPPPGAAFYPYYTITGNAPNCTYTFGDNKSGFSDTEYGTDYTAWFFGTFSSGVINTCSNV